MLSAGENFVVTWMGAEERIREVASVDQLEETLGESVAIIPEVLVHANSEESTAIGAVLL